MIRRFMNGAQIEAGGPTREHGDRLLLFAKDPTPGQVKTRLCPPLAPAAAARLYAAFLHDVAAESRSPDWDARFCVWPNETFPAQALPVETQRGADLGARMAAAMAEAFADGAERVVIRNTDSPTLPRARLTEAFVGLANSAIDVVLGPDVGGGYYLVGVRAARLPLVQRHLLEPLREWPASEVFRETVAAARRAQLCVLVLRRERDVDVPDDLAWLRGELERHVDRAPMTAACLREL